MLCSYLVIRVISNSNMLSNKCLLAGLPLPKCPNFAQPQTDKFALLILCTHIPLVIISFGCGYFQACTLLLNYYQNLKVACYLNTGAL